MIDVASTSVSRFHKNKIGIKFIDVVYTYQKSFNFVSAFACYKQNVSWPRSIWPNLYAKQEVKVIWQKAPHGGGIPRLGVTPGGRKLYHWIPGVGFPISVP